MNPQDDLNGLDQEYAQQEPLRLGSIDLTTARDPGPVKWIVENWIPANRVSGLWGDGGAGKSTIAQLLLTSCVIGKPWFGLNVVQGPALGFFAEDDEDEVLRRQFRINDVLGISMAELAGKLHLIPRLGKPNALAIHRSGALEMTDEFDQLNEFVRNYKPKLAAIDNLIQVYGGEQANSNHIAAFVNAISGMVRAVEGAALLLGHPGKAEGNEYAGPFAWNATVRARMFLQEDKGGTRKLCRKKANYADKDEAIDLEWRHGLYLPTNPDLMTPAERLAAELERGKARQEFLDALDRTAKQGINLSHSKQAANYGPRYVVERRYANGFEVRAMERAMIDLLDEGRIVANAPIAKSKSRHPVYGLARTVESPS